jgi:hypothetical protein
MNPVGALHSILSDAVERSEPSRNQRSYRCDLEILPEIPDLFERIFGPH